MALAGVVPDADGLGYLLDRYNAFVGVDSYFYFNYHHVTGHNLLASVMISVTACLFAAKRRVQVFILSLLVVHLHFLCDLAGSRGPDGYQWPIRYLYPFADGYEWTWSGQWELSAWQNALITLGLLGWAIAWSYQQRYSFVEVISQRLDREFFKIVARRWGAPS